jgi:PPM family protein phosphatase
MNTDQYYRTLTVSGRTDTGECRSFNEDGFVITSIPSSREPAEENDRQEDEFILLVVADGSGGSEAGNLASGLIHKFLLEELQAKAQGDNSIEALRIAVERSNAHLYEQTLSNQSFNYFAAITAVLIEGELATVAQIGDTRAYLCRGEQLVQITMDQTLVEQLLRNNLLTSEQVEDLNTYSQVLLQSLGAAPEIKVAFTQVHLKQNDRVLLCSDGLWRKVSDNEIRETLNNNFRVDEACEDLIESAYEKGGQDNITIIVAEATGEDLPEVIESENPNQMFTILSVLEDIPGIPKTIE